MPLKFAFFGVTYSAMTLTWPTDSGPIYKETHMGRWPVEPWNTWSLLIFLVLVVYWLWTIRHNWKNHKLILITTCLTGVGFIGGFVYHSTRSHLFWLLLDWGPILINANLLSVSLWWWSTRKWLITIVGAYLPILLSLPIYTHLAFESNLASSLGYMAMVSSVLVPLALWARKTEFKYIKWVFWSATTITVAILLRTFDKHPVMDIFPMGTHFLWHTLGALTFHFITLYVYKTRLSTGLITKN